MFRIAIGSCSCAGSDQMTGVSRIACDQVSAKLQQLRNLSFAQLSTFQETQTEDLAIGELKFLSSIQITVLGEQLLVVVQIFHPTWKFPNYFSRFGIGKKFAEGFVVNPNGEKLDASEEVLWEYR